MGKRFTHFVSGLRARVAQNKFVGHVKILRSPDPHAAGRLKPAL